MILSVYYNFGINKLMSTRDIYIIYIYKYTMERLILSNLQYNLQN